MFRQYDIDKLRDALPVGGRLLPNSLRLLFVKVLPTRVSLTS